MAVRRRSGALGIRGIMLDPARLVERHGFYFDLLPRLAEWGFNTIWWHFSDDEGFALKLDSHPELATPFAFTKAETRRFIAAAADVGIDVVPEVESLGHTRYITRLPRYAHLADGSGGWRNACCPSHRDTLRLLKDVLVEVADLFPSGYLHAGLDEVDFSECPRCRRRGKGKPSWWVYAEHAKAIHRIVTGAGKRMIMWADHVEHDRGLRRMLPKDIVLAHWQYSEVRPDEIRGSLDAGFEVVACPALSHAGTMIQPRAVSFRTMDKTVTAAASLGERGVLGVVNTWWTARRLLRDAALPAVAYTGKILSTARSANKQAFADRYGRETFGLISTRATRALWDMHWLVPDLQELGVLLFDSVADIVDAIDLARADGFTERAEKIDHCARTLAAARGKVKRRPEEYNALVISAKVASACMHSGRKVLEAYELYRKAESARDACGDLDRALEPLCASADALADIQPVLDEACQLVSKEWDRTRHPRDEKKANRNVATTPCPGDSLLGRMVRCQDHNRKLVRRYRQAIRAYRRGGPFPAISS